MNIEHCLATYGTLAPGRANHRQLADLRGEWRQGTVKGRFVEKGWGAAHGFPALVLAQDGADVEVSLFTSTDLPDHWDRLDAFEGDEYRRARVRVLTATGATDAWIYVSADAGA